MNQEKQQLHRALTEQEVSHILGWSVFQVHGKKRVLKETNEYTLWELRDERKCVEFKEMPYLSKEEAKIVREIVNVFQTQKESENQKESEKNKTIHTSLHAYIQTQGIRLTDEQKKYMEHACELQVNGWMGLKYVLEWEDIEEITVIGIGNEKPVRVFHRLYGWMECNWYYGTEECIRELINKMAREHGRRLSWKTPHVHAVLENGFRLSASMKPLAWSGIQFTIRRFKQHSIQPSELIQWNTANAEMLAFLELAMESECSMLVCGNTGSGKTTTLNALFYFVPANERIIIVEETPEVKLQHAHAIQLNTVEEHKLTMAFLITETLRMRPDRVIVGEIRTPEEAKAFMDTLQAGQGKGSYGTFHALNAKECCKRLNRMGIPAIDQDSLDIIIVQRRWTQIHKETGQRTEKRAITEIAEIENGKPKTLIEWNHKKQEWENKNESTRVSEKIQNTFGVNREEVKKLMGERMNKLKQHKNQDI